MTITCGHCGVTSPIDSWTETPVAGPLPRDTFQCPKCRHAFKRSHGKPKVYPNGFIMPGPVTIVPVTSVL